MSACDFFFGAIPCLIADSLAQQPGRWSLAHTGELVRDDLITVWVSNGIYGMEVLNHPIADHGHDGTRLWGSVTVFSCFYLSPGHWLLHIAARRWLARSAISKASPSLDGGRNV